MKQSMSGLKRIFAFLSCVAVLSVANARPPQKIVGGSWSQDSEFPYQASLRKDGRHFCGGAIIDKRHIITAAHCVVGVIEKPFTNVTVMTGANVHSGGQVHRVRAVFPHADFIHLKQHDIAIIEVTDEIEFNSSQDKIGLPTKETKSGVPTVASGWGAEHYHKPKVSDKLRKVTLHTLSHNDCQLFAKYFTISRHQICTYGAPGLGVCVGDSGGPLVHNNTLVGIVSYGAPCALGIPDVYTNVYYYRDWIKEKCNPA